jgi:hypothetical protein
VNDAKSLIENSIGSVGAQGAFLNIYKTALAAHAVLAKLHGQEVPAFTHASGILQRIPVHLLVSQGEAAEVELRRVIELLFLTTYFTDHPVEWDAFVRQPRGALQHERENPIAASAAREPAYYRGYAKERFLAEPSGIAKDAVGRLSVEYGNLSSAAHAPAGTEARTIHAVVSIPTPAVLGHFATRFKSIASDVCVVASALVPGEFDQLPPMYRAWFDWLLGQDAAKKLRGGKFGLRPLRR